MMNFVYLHRIKLYFGSMSLILSMAYIYEDYLSILYGVICSVFLFILKKYDRLVRVLNYWF